MILSDSTAPHTSALRVLLFWTGVALLSFAGLFWMIYRPVGGGLDTSGYMLGRDFINIWMGAKLTLSGHVESLFHLREYITQLREVFGPKYNFHNWSYPPTLLPLITMFGLMPYFPALLLWSVLGLAFYVMVCRWYLGKNASPAWLWLLALAPASLINLISGQNGFFTAAFFLGGLYLLPRRPIIAGIFFGLLTVKPQLGLLLPLALIVMGSGRSFFSAAITCIAMAAFSYLLWGSTPWHEYFTITIPYQQSLLSSFKGFYVAMMPGMFTALRLVGIEQSIAYFLHAFTALLAAACALSICRRERLSPRAVLALAIASLLVTPYGFNYDMPAITAAIAYYLQTARPQRIEMHALGILWAAPLLCFALNGVFMPIIPFVMLGVILLLTNQSFASSQSSHPAAS